MSKQAFLGLSIVEQQAIKQFIESNLNIQKNEEKIAHTAQTINNIFDQSQKTKHEKQKQELLYTTKFIQHQINQKSKESQETSELSKTEYNKTLTSLPINQVCIFPKITERTSIELLETKRKQQKELYEALNQQIKIKENIVTQASHENKGELIKEIDLKKQLDNELTEKKNKEKEDKKRYKQELDSQVTEKSKYTPVEKPNQAEVTSFQIGKQDIEDAPIEINKEGTDPIKEEITHSNTVDNIKPQEVAPAEEQHKNEATEYNNIDKTAKNNVRAKSIISHTSSVIDSNDSKALSMQTDYDCILLQKIANYEKRMKAKGKSIYSIEQLKNAVMHSHNIHVPKSVRSTPLQPNRYIVIKGVILSNSEQGMRHLGQEKKTYYLRNVHI